MKGLTSIGSAVFVAALLTVPGVTAVAEDPAAPVEFSGRLRFGPCFGQNKHDWSDRVQRERAAAVGRYCQPQIVEPFSDPRLEGEVFVWRNSDRHMHGPTVTYSGFSIRNADGAWQQIPGISTDFSDRSDSTGTFVLEGSGAYDGLIAIAEIGLEQDVWTWRGWILDGALPPAPEPPAPAR